MRKSIRLYAVCTLFSVMPSALEASTELTSPDPLNREPFVQAIAVSHDTLDFGSVAVGSETSRTLRIANSGDEPLTITVVETDSVDFLGNAMTIDSGKGGQTLAAGDTVSVVIRMHPASIGQKNTTLTITHDAPGEASPILIRLLGEGIAQEGEVTMSVEPDTLQMGDVAVGDSKRDTVTITNTGTGTLTGTVTPKSDFLDNAMELFDGEGNFTLTAGATREVIVEIHPASINDKASSFDISHNATNEADPFTVPVFGRGVAAPGTPAIDVSPDSLAFGEVPVGGNKVDTVTITNTGEGTLTGTVTPDSEFLGNAMELKDGEGSYTLSAGEVRRIIVEIHPASVGSKASFFTISHNAPAPPTSPIRVDVTGQGTATADAAISVDPPSFDFGDVDVGGQAEKVIVLKSTGSATLSGSVGEGAGFPGAGYTIESGEGLYDLESGAQKNISIRFAPQSAGSKEGVLKIFHNAPGVATPVEVELTGVGKVEQPLTAPVLVSPADGAEDVSTTPTFSWRAVASAEEYRIRVSTAADLSNPVLDRDQTDTTASGISLDQLTTYHWAVSASKDEDTVTSATWSFLTAAGPNTAPVAVDDSITVGSGVESVLLVLENDTDADGDPLSITGISEDPINGTATWSATEIRYTPNPGFLANDLLVYTISDGRGGVDDASVFIRVSATTASGGDLPAGVTELRQNYPNPFSTRSMVAYALAEPGEVRIELLDMLGRTVRVLLEARQHAGNHQLLIKRTDLPSGMYLLRMRAGTVVQTRGIAVVD